MLKKHLARDLLIKRYLYSLNFMLEILYQDEQLIAINKPHGLLVHRSSLAADAEEFALQLLRNQIGRWVNPVHRLDRKTSGILVFALDKDTEVLMHKQFAANQVKKNYLAIVRGHTPDSATIDYALRKENGALQEALTNYTTIKRAEIDLPFGKHSTSRYSLVEAVPETGRMHQLRRHFAHINHPIIGDRPHGCNKQNKLFKDTYNMTSMMLHASEISFDHPVLKMRVKIEAPLQSEFKRMMQIMGWELSGLL